MAGLLKNKFVIQPNGLDYSRSLFRYEKRHSTNLLAGMIVPVHTEFLLPGTSPDWNFGCVIESAPLIATNFDNIYVDIVCIWTPLRLVMTDWNEFLGESHTQAFTINRNITIPKITQIHCDSMLINGSTRSISQAYLADNYLAPHIGFRASGLDTSFAGTTFSANSIFAKGVSVLPSRVYELNWNTFFRNENIQAPILIDKTSTVGSHDATYANGLGKLQVANKLKNWFTVSTPSPSLLDVSIAMDAVLPVITNSSEIDTTGMNPMKLKDKYGYTVGSGQFNLFSGGNVLKSDNTAYTAGNSPKELLPSNLIVDTAQLTVNRMYYALMEQRFANKMMKGRRAVEFYKNFFGVNDSAAADDLPTLLVQKRFPLNISQVIATSASTNTNGDSTDLGQKGAYSVTGFGDTLVKDFTATEHGYIQTYMIIRGQPSLADGIDHHLGFDSLLDTYIPEFDHIGPVGIDELEILGPATGRTVQYFGYTNAWYFERNQVSDCVGIVAPGQPMEYKTLAYSFGLGIPAGGSPNVVISDAVIRFDPRIMDRLFMLPVCYGTANGQAGSGSDIVYFDDKGEEFTSNRYQFITQFVVKGKIAKVMSPDSEPLKLRL